MLERYILSSLSYCQVFNSVYTKEELQQWLVIKKTTISRLNNALKKLEGEKKIIYKNNQFGLSSSSDFSNHSKIYIEKLKIAQKAARLLKIIPTIKLIAVSGSLAAGRPQKNSDIDFFIICSPDSVWLSRFFSVLILRLFHLYRRRTNSNNSQAKNTICLNMFLDTNNLVIKGQNIYSAREILQIKPIVNSGQTYEKFLYSNVWVKKIFPNFIFPPKPKRIITPRTNIFFKLIHKPSYLLQYFYMRSHITSEIVKPNEIRFHPVDYQSIILKKYIQIISNKNIKLTLKEQKLIFSNSLDKKN